jgi:hypothetical protein
MLVLPLLLRLWMRRRRLERVLHHPAARRRRGLRLLLGRWVARGRLQRPVHLDALHLIPRSFTHVVRRRPHLLRLLLRWQLRMPRGDG